jgi:hypothetical protein
MCHDMIEVWHFNKALGPGASFDKACHSGIFCPITYFFKLYSQTGYSESYIKT